MLNGRVELCGQSTFVGKALPNDGKYPRWSDHPCEWNHWNKYGVRDLRKLRNCEVMSYIDVNVTKGKAEGGGNGGK